MTEPASRPARALRARPRAEVRRGRERAGYEREQAYAILDAGILAHVGFASAGSPFVIPMLYARDGDSLLLHGAVASRLQRALASGIECCVTVTHLDGIVLARSHFHHSVNYRSLVVFGRARPVADPMAKRAALVRFVDWVLPGRAADSRAANARELGATSVLALPIAEFSAKVRNRGPKDHPDDLAARTWAGVVPLALRCGVAQPDEGCERDALPEYVGALLTNGPGRR